MNETQAEATEAPEAAPVEVDQYEADQALEKTLDSGLAVLAEIGDNDDYQAERRDRQAYARGEKFDTERTKAGHERWDRISEAMAESEAAIQAASTHDELAKEHQRFGVENVEDQIAYASLRGQATAVDISREKESPGWLARCNETAATYGQLEPEVAKLMMASPYYGELVETILDYPENIAELNSMSPDQVKLRIAKAEGYFLANGGGRAQQQQQRPAPKQSTAPKPVSTVSGRSHAHSKTPDEMDYSEYKAWRQKEMGKRR